MSKQMTYEYEFDLINPVEYKLKITLDNPTPYIMKLLELSVMKTYYLNKDKKLKSIGIKEYCKQVFSKIDNFEITRENYSSIFNRIQHNLNRVCKDVKEQVGMDNIEIKSFILDSLVYNKNKNKNTVQMEMNIIGECIDKRG